jgi:hypothetical protein
MKTFNIAVLDFGTCQVAMYHEIELDKDLDPDAEETFIIDQGHNLKNCQWMVSENEISVQYY